MNKFVCLLLSAAFASSVAGCASAPVERDNSAEQRSRAEKAQSELGAEVSKQKTEKEKY